MSNQLKQRQSRANKKLQSISIASNDQVEDPNVSEPTTTWKQLKEYRPINLPFSNDQKKKSLKICFFILALVIFFILIFSFYFLSSKPETLDIQNKEIVSNSEQLSKKDESIGNQQNKNLQNKDKSKIPNKEKPKPKTQINRYKGKYSQSKLQTKTIPNFGCKNQDFKKWNSNNANVYVTKDGFRLERVPYPQLVLVQNSKDVSPTYHFPQLVAYLKQNPAKTSVYVDSASVYAILLIGAISSQNVSIIIAHDYPDKYLVQTCFVLNNIKDKVTFQEEKDAKKNIQGSDLLITTQPDFAKAHIKTKTIIFVVDTSSPSASPSKDTIYKLKSKESCSLPQLIHDSRALLDKGIYIGKQTGIENQIQDNTKKTQGKGQKKVKDTKYSQSKLQTKTIPNFGCKNQDFKKWNSNNANVYVTKDGFRLERVPYPQLVLVQNSKDVSPTYHFPQLVAYLKQNPAKTSVYVDSASVYAILLIGAISSQNVSIIIAHDYPDKYLVQTCFVLNNIKDKVTFQEEKDAKKNIQGSDLLITTSTDFAKTHIKAKTIIFVVDTSSPSASPSKDTIYKLESKETCSVPSLNHDSRDSLSLGVYISQKVK